MTKRAAASALALSVSLVFDGRATGVGEPVDVERGVERELHGDGQPGHREGEAFQKAQESARAPAVHRERGRAYLDEERWVEAISEYQQVVELVPDDVWSHYLLGYAYCGKAYQDRSQPLLDKGIAVYQRALEIRPDFPEALSELGTAYHMVGDYGRAIEAFSKVRALRPDWEVPRSNLADSYRAMGLWEPALGEYRWLLQHPGSFRDSLYHIHNAIGLVHEGALKFPEAAAAFTAATALNPDYFPARMNLGRVYVQQSKLDEAIAEYKEAIRLQPESAELEFTVSRLYALRKHHDLALEALARAVQKGFADYEAIRRSPSFRRLRNDPRFLNLIGDDR
jgi:tetratricopeptide (TPR) repeat protein